MIIYHRTSILESTAQTAVNTVNCVGVMGKGLAHAYKKRYPKMFTTYKKYCDDGLFEPGKLWLWKADDQWVLNFPTKQHWRSPSKIEWLEAGLQKFVATYEERGITHISFPKLGCGNGNLDWENVRPLMEKHLASLPIEVWVHDHNVDIGMPEHLEAFSTEQKRRDLPLSREELWGDLERISSSVGDRLIDFKTNESFRVKTMEDVLVVETRNDRSFLTKDELTDAWAIISRGILTRKKLGISDAEEASRIISLFSLMPHAEPVEIGFPSSDVPEIAAQIRYSNHSENPSNVRQSVLPWH